MAKKRVLVVEDETAIAMLVALIIREMGLEAETAANGAQAITKLEKQLPDLIITDLIMPVMTGEELIQQVQGNPDWAHIPIVLLSTRHSAKGYRKDEFPLISKPFEPSAVKDIVRQVLNLS